MVTVRIQWTDEASEIELSRDLPYGAYKQGTDHAFFVDFPTSEEGDAFVAFMNAQPGLSAKITRTWNIQPYI